MMFLTESADMVCSPEALRVSFWKRDWGSRTKITLAINTSTTGARVTGCTRAARAVATPLTTTSAAAQPKRPKEEKTPAISPPKPKEPIMKA